MPATTTSSGTPRTPGQRDYYEVLGVAPDADAKQIKDAFRRLALRYHPDRSTEPDAEERFKEIAQAYAVLSDPAKRADYDQRGFAGVAGFSPEDLFAGLDLTDLFGDSPFDFGGGLFERLFGHPRRRGPRPGGDLQVTLTVPLERVLHGGTEPVALRRPTRCDPCGGTGAAPGTSPRPCDACGGTGRHVTRSQRGGVAVQQITTCTSCGGRAAIIDRPCSECGGIGQAERIEHLDVKIPPGAEDGMALRLPGRGLPSDDPAGPPGDAYVVVSTAPDPRFERRGPHLWRPESIDVADAVLGTTVEIPTLAGPVTLTVPPGAQPDAVLRLRGKGLPQLGGGPRGDLYITLQIQIPTELTREEQRLWERLRRMRHP